MIIYVTKYALTSGIYKYDANIDGKMATVYMPRSYTMCFHGKDWHYTPEDAALRADQMLKKKITALRKQLDKYEGMVFNSNEIRDLKVLK